MNTLKQLGYVLVALVSPALLSAQTPLASTPPAQEEVVKLSPFTVSATPLAPYQAIDATSGSRIAIPLMDSTQHVSVVTRDLVDDIGATRQLDAAKYIAGVSEATIPNAQDRTNIRGFQVDGVTIDGFGFNSFTFANYDPVFVDRIEVVKGPNAVLAPSGQPGGTEDVVTKRPFFSNRGYISAEGGLWDAQRAEFDVNQVVTPDKLAVRVVGAVQRTDDFPGNGNFHRSLAFMPEFTYRFSRASELTVELEVFDFRTLNYLGIPLDPYVGTNDKARLISGVSRTLVPDDSDTVRYNKGLRSRAFFTTNITDRFSMRVATNFVTTTGLSAQSNLSGPNPTVIDPTTGIYSVPSPAPTVTRTYTRSYSYAPQVRRNFDLQNDFVYHLKTNGVDSNTVFGYWLAQSLEYNRTFNYTKPSFSIDAYTAAAPVFTSFAGLQANLRRVRQLYANETLSFFDDRLVLNGGVARASYQNHINDQLRGLQAQSNPYATLPTVGAVIKPIPEVSFFGGVSRNSIPIDPSTTSTIPYTLQTSRQTEYGLRVQLFNKKLYATVSHFDIKQNNYSVPNPANLTVPPPFPALPPLFMDRHAYGWEFECTAAVTSNFSLIGNYTSFKNRNPYGQVFRGIAEQSGAVWGSYAFKTGSLKGLTLGAGLEYMDKRPGDAPGGPLTSASTPTDLIVVQPTFWLPAHTLVNASITYKIDAHWKTQLNIDNLFNVDYLAASINRYMVTPGERINARFTITYNF